MTSDKYEPECGTMKQSGVGQYVKLSDYRILENQWHQSNKEIADLDLSAERLRKKIIKLNESINLKDFMKLKKENKKLKAEIAYYKARCEKDK